MEQNVLKGADPDPKGGRNCGIGKVSAQKDGICGILPLYRNGKDGGIAHFVPPAYLLANAQRRGQILGHATADQPHDGSCLVVHCGPNPVPTVRLPDRLPRPTTDQRHRFQRQEAGA